MRPCVLIGLGMALSLGGLACGGARFACLQDDDCAGVGSDGRCEDAGVCSTLDGECESGRRYAEHGGDLSGTCVPVEGTTSSTVATTTDDPSATTTVTTTTIGSTGPATTGDDTTAVESSTGDPAKCVEDGFDGGELAPGFCELIQGTGAMLTLLPDGYLEVTIDPASIDPNAAAAYASAQTCGISDWTGAEATVELVTVPGGPGIETYLDFSTGLDFVGLFISNGTLVHYSLKDGVSAQYASVEYGPNIRWVNIVHDPESATVETWFSDGVLWMSLGESPDLDIPRSSWIEAGAGAYEMPEGPAIAVFDNFSVCVP